MGGISTESMTEDYKGEWNLPPTKVFILNQWAVDVTDVLQKPAVAVILFFLGVFFIIFASKQVKWMFEILGYLGFGYHLKDGFMGNLMVPFMIVFVWLDIVLVMRLKTLAVCFAGIAYRKFRKLINALHKMDDEEETEEINEGDLFHARQQRRRKM